MFDEDLKRKEELEQQALARGTGVAATGAGVSTEAGGATSAPKPPPQSGSGWVNLQDYLGANQQAGQKAAESLAGSVSAQGKDAGSAMDTLSASFTNSMRQAQGGRSAGFGRNPTKPTALSKNSMAELDGYGDASLKIQTASDAANNLADSQNRSGVIREHFGKGGSYTAGMNRWDNALVNATEGGAFQKVKDSYGGLSDALGVAVDKSAADAATYGGELKDWQGRQASAAGVAREHAAKADALVGKTQHYLSEITKLQKMNWHNARPGSEELKLYNKIVFEHQRLKDQLAAERAASSPAKTQFTSSVVGKRADTDKRAQPVPKNGIHIY